MIEPYSKEEVEEYLLRVSPVEWTSSKTLADVLRYPVNRPAYVDLSKIYHPKIAKRDNISAYLKWFVRLHPEYELRAGGRHSSLLIRKRPVVVDTTLPAISQLRRAMGTLPASFPAREDRLFTGLDHLRVTLVDYPANPYRAIYEVVTSTWADREHWLHRWNEATEDGRVKVVLAALGGKTLRQALECGSWTFLIQGCSRGAFDQLARHRATGIGSVGSRDNSHLDAALVVPPKLWKQMDDDLRRDLIDWWTSTKYLYARILSMRSGKETWQNARFILPSGMEWRFSWTMNTRALWDSVMPQRLHFCEQYDTVGVAWKMWLAIWDKFPLIAAHLRPGCDWAHKCVYADQYKLSELFGCLFKSCGRYKVDDSLYATFNESSTSIEEMEELLHMKIPRPDDWGKLVDVALAKDWKYFK